MMSNALKFTNEGQIAVRLSIDDIKPSTPKEDSVTEKDQAIKVDKSDDKDITAKTHSRVTIPIPKSHSNLTDKDETLNFIN